MFRLRCVRHFSVRKQIEAVGSVATLDHHVLPVYFLPETASAAALLPFPVPALQELSSKVGDSSFVYYSQPAACKDDDLQQQQALVVGLGSPDTLDEEVVRTATHAAMTRLATKKSVTAAALVLPTVAAIDAHRMLQLATQVCMLSNYTFDKYLTEKQPEAATTTPESSQVSQVYLVTDDAAATETAADLIAEQRIIAEETLLARDLGNDRSDVVTPAFMEQMARQAVADLPGLTINVLQQPDLLAQGLHMLHAVGQAATCAPRLVLLEYKGGPEEDPPIALVGKGVTFDTGGLNLKPTGFIEDMHMDMCGSAAVLCTMRAAARLKLKRNIVAVLPLAENAIGSAAVKPHAILKSYHGKTVEVNNTDAEGRLILADALSYVQEQYQPDTVIDTATLTGACVVALGEHAAGLFSNDEALAASLLHSGDCTHERCWRMPILKEHREELKGTFSDSRSTGKGRYGGACTAAAFLEQFVQKHVKWAHIDIAGPASYSSKQTYMPKGATGFGVHLLVDFLKKTSRN